MIDIGQEVGAGGVGVNEAIGGEHLQVEVIDRVAACLCLEGMGVVSGYAKRFPEEVVGAVVGYADRVIELVGRYAVGNDLID